jgi:hypothetical protein
MLDRRLFSIALLCFVIVFLNACAFDLANIKYEPTQVVAASDTNKSIVFYKAVPISNPPCGYSRVLEKDKKWLHIGNIDKGDVFKPIGHCFTVECSNVFEAYLVLHQESLVGFYLPVEKGFIALSKPIDLPIH